MNPMDRQTEGQKPQHQDRQPGIESKMEPLPLTEDPDYKGTGKLKGKTAIITGETAESAKLQRSHMQRKAPTLPFCIWKSMLTLKKRSSGLSRRVQIAF